MATPKQIADINDAWDEADRLMDDADNLQESGASTSLAHEARRKAREAQMTAQVLEKRYDYSA